MKVDNELWDEVESSREKLNDLILIDADCQQCGLIDIIEPPWHHDKLPQ